VPPIIVEGETSAYGGEDIQRDAEAESQDDNIRHSLMLLCSYFNKPQKGHGGEIDGKTVKKTVHPSFIISSFPAVKPLVRFRPRSTQ